jgi:phosphoglycolate phosphatase
LIDSQAKIIHCVQEACRLEGFAPPDAQTIASIIGLSLKEAFLDILPHIEPSAYGRIRDRYRELFLHRDETPMPLFPAVTELLDTLEKAEFKLAVATGKSRAGLDKVLTDTGLTRRFHCTRCADETASKPDPRMLEEILDELKVSKDEAVMIGDSSFDLEMARNLGMDSIAVTSGSHDVETLRRYAPLHILESVTQLSRLPVQN